MSRFTNALVAFALFSASALADGQDIAPDDGRRLAESSTLRGSARMMIEADVTPLMKLAGEIIYNSGFPDPITADEDRASVFLSSEGANDNRCWIVFEATNSADDWIRNLDLGSEKIQSILKTNKADKSCGCKKKVWFYCTQYHSCPVYTEVGSGYDGFVKDWNKMRIQVSNQVESKCGTASDYVFTGYSRGAGLAQIAAYGMWKEGLLPENKMKLVTLGSPRALNDNESDQIHEKFLQYRLVYEDDPLASLPLWWWGFKHFGTPFPSSGALDRDEPRSTNPLKIDDHSLYDEWLGIVRA